jgi:hypothetical protein
MSVNTKVNGQLVPSAGLYSVTKPIGMADIYSTEEKEVGLWINNKPLYQKSFTFTSGWTLGNWTALADLSALNIDDFVSSNSKISRTGDIQLAFNGSLYPESSNTTNYKVSVRYNGGNLEVLVVTYDNISEIVVTIQYTKTTDTPWSGKFVPQGYGYVSSGDIYSFEERRIGVYTDGKPLYQKTVDFGALPNNTTKQVAHNVANLDKIAYVNGIINYSGLIYGEDMPPVILSKSFRTAVRENVVEISTTDNLSSYGAIVTFQYTKTTDVAGSGEYVPSGDKAVHYSEDEEVIGTFLGETLYRKVVSLSTSLLVSYNSWTSTGITIANTDKVISCGTISVSKVFSMMLAYFDNGELKIQTPRNGTTEEINTIILEYTKTS